METKRKRGQWFLIGLIIFLVALMFVNMLAAFIFSLFAVLLILSSSGYGEPQGKWGAYTVGKGNWRIGGVHAGQQEYNEVLNAEMKEKSKLGSAGLSVIIIVIICIISAVLMLFGVGSLISV